MARDDLPALTGLRFFAAIWVVLFHLAGPAAATLPLPARTLLSRGWMGVPLFFILSGFILAHAYAPAASDAGAPPLDRRRFWWARVARVYPLYLLSLAVAWPLLLHARTPITNSGMLQEQGATVLLVQAWNPWLPFVWNPPTWSLSVEAALYLAFPFAVGWVCALCRRRSPWLVATAFWAVGVFLQTELSAVVPALGLPEGLAGRLPVWWLPFFLQGVGLWYAWNAWRNRARAAPRWALPALLLAGLAAASVPVVTAGYAFGVLTMLLEFGFGLLIVLLADARTAPAWLATRWMVRLGEASYGMYLLHIPLNGWVALLRGRPLEQPAVATWTGFLAITLALVALCLALHAWVEKPAQRWLRRQGPGAPAHTGEAAVGS